MKIIFENKNSRFEQSDIESIEDMMYAITSGIIAMGYHMNTANSLIDSVESEIKEILESNEKSKND